MWLSCVFTLIYFDLQAHPSGGVLLNCGSSSASPSQRSPSGVPPNKTSATAAVSEHVCVHIVHILKVN